MPADPNAFAEMVALTIKAALTPVLERVAGLEAQVKQALAVEPSVMALRDRVVAVEVKAAAAPTPTEPPDVDLTPIVERIASIEAKANLFAETPHEVTALRDRLVVVETKAATPVSVPEPAAVDLTPVLERLAGVDARLARLAAVELSLGEMRDRLVTVETKAAAPLPAVEAHPESLTPVLERLAGVDARLTRVDPLEATIGELSDRLLTIETKSALPVEHAAHGPTSADVELQIHAALDPLHKSLNAVQERVAVMEVRAQIPGPPGRDGAPGANGTNGKDGADGVGFDDLTVEQEGERSIAVKAVRGDRTKTLGTLTFPVDIYRGVYVEGKSYERGDCVTWGGSEWHANDTTTTKPGDGSKCWTLKVKRGRDGRDGKDAETTPVVSIGRPS